MEQINNFLASVHHLNHPFLSIVSGIGVLLLGLFVLFKNKNSSLFKIFFFLNLSMSIWFICNAFSMYYYANFDKAILWFKFGYTGVIFMPAIYYHFYLVYFEKKTDRLLIIFYFISIVEILITFFSEIPAQGAFFLSNVGIVQKFNTPVFYYSIFGMGKYFTITLFTAFSFKKLYNKEKDAYKKIQLKYLTLIFFILVLGFIEWISVIGIQAHIAWFLVPFFLFLIAYTILKYQLMNIKVIVKKAFFYAMGIATASGFIVVISFSSDWLNNNIPGIKSWTVPLAAGTTAFILGRIFWEKSKEVDKLKYEFITIAAHKLRTPLTEVKWGVEALKDKAMSEAEKKELLSKIADANNRTIELTDELLSVSKIEKDQTQYKLEPVDLEKIAREVINDFQHQMKEKNIKLSYKYEKNLLFVNVDKTRISSVVQTLVENAINYTKNEINIFIDTYKNNIIFHIEDNGIGVKKEDQPYIFSKFYRSHEAYLTETEGTGIGLFLAKSIIDKHNGKIGVRSEGDGRGSIFWFSLPMA